MARHNINNNLTTDGTRRGQGDTGLLTRCVPARLKHSALYRWFLRLTRVLQFLSALISLAAFSSRLYKVYRLVNQIKTHRGVSHADGAVEGILAAAVLYTLIATLFALLMRRGGGPTWLRWIWVLLDIAFVGAFIAVADLTSPHGGPAGPRHCYRESTSPTGYSATNKNRNKGDPSCDLPWATFILAILSTILHAITAAFHEVREHHRGHKDGINNGHNNMAESDSPYQRDGTRYQA